MNQQELERLEAIENAVKDLQALVQEFRIGTKWARRTVVTITTIVGFIIATADTWRAWVLYAVTGK